MRGDIFCIVEQRHHDTESLTEDLYDAHGLRIERRPLVPPAVVGALIVSPGKERSLVLSPRAMLSHEPIEWPDEVEVLVDRLESESAQRSLSREERALMDVYETVPLLEGEEGLHGFWQSGVNQQRVIASFEMVGAAGMVDPLKASQWCETRPAEPA